MLPLLLLQSVTVTRVGPGISGCMLVMWNAFFRQFCLQAKNEQEDCAYYKEDSDRGSHGILHLSSGRSPSLRYRPIAGASVTALTPLISPTGTMGCVPVRK